MKWQGGKKSKPFWNLILHLIEISNIYLILTTEKLSIILLIMKNINRDDHRCLIHGEEKKISYIHDSMTGAYTSM